MVRTLSPIRSMSCCKEATAAEIITALSEGAREELLLTPKPGLVDVYDSGSHSDLSFGKMCASIDLLEQYYTELSDALKRGTTLHELRTLGIAAEGRMMDKCGTNAHRGFLFSSALFLIAALARDDAREGIRNIAACLFEEEPEETKGSIVRKEHRVGGIIAESLKGFPAVFEDALPAYQKMMQERGNSHIAGLYAMSRLMQTVEDTTALSRCGGEGLAKIKADGARIQQMIEEGRSAYLYLQELNGEYKKMNLTMGGVADMLALTFALAKLV